MKTKFYFLFVVFIIAFKVHAQNLEWAKRVGGVGQELTTGMVADSAGNIFVIGLFQDTVDFDPGPGIQNLVTMYPPHQLHIG